MKNRITVIVLALLLGGLGVHRFYLGQYFRGLLYFLFVWTFIPILFALSDAINFYTMPQSKFDALYNKDRLKQPAIEVHDFLIVGVIHNEKAYKSAQLWDDLILEPEPDNQYDPTAVRVTLTKNNQRIGYIAREQKVFLYKYLLAGKPYAAQLSHKDKKTADCYLQAPERIPINLHS